MVVYEYRLHCTCRQSMEQGWTSNYSLSNFTLHHTPHNAPLLIFCTYICLFTLPVFGVLVFFQEQWFVKGRKNSPASGSLEDRLRYVRMKHFKHIRDTNPTTTERKSLHKAQAPLKWRDLTHLEELTESQGILYASLCNTSGRAKPKISNIFMAVQSLNVKNAPAGHKTIM